MGGDNDKPYCLRDGVKEEELGVTANGHRGSSWHEGNILKLYCGYGCIIM